MLQITSSCSHIFPSKIVFKYWNIIYMFRDWLPNMYLMFWMVNFEMSNIFIFWSIYFHTAAIWNRKDSFLIPFDIRLGLWSFVFFQTRLILYCRYKTLGNLLLLHKTLFQDILHLQAWPIGVSLIIISLFISIPLGLLRFPLVVISSSLKWWESLFKVILDRYSHSCHISMGLIDLCPIYRLCDNCVHRNNQHITINS